MTAELIESAKVFVKELFEREYSGHDYFHTLRVFRMATCIAKGEGAELLSVQLAALLHDVDDRKLSAETHESQTRARAFLSSHGVDGESVERICQMIREISFGENDAPPSTLEGQCVQDADRLDAIGAIGIARAFAYGGYHNRPMHDPAVLPKLTMTKAEYLKSESTTVNHFYEKLLKLPALMNTRTARELAQGREACMQSFLAEFFDEWDGLR